MNIPLAAKIKQQAALRREQQLAQKNGTLRGTQFAMAGGRFAGTNRASWRNDRSNDFFTKKELDEALEKSDPNRGKRFRFLFFLFIFFMIILLGYSKYDSEMHIEVPQIESGRGFGEIKDSGVEEKQSIQREGAFLVSKDELPELQRHIDFLKLKTNVPYKKDDGVDAEKERRRDQYKLKQAAKKALEEHNDKFGQLVACGRSCQNDHKQVEAAFSAIDSLVPRDIYKAMFDIDNTKEKRNVGPKELKETYEKKKAMIEEVEKDSEDRAMMLAELKDAYDILQSPESRVYYSIYGRKPPEYMKHISARHGGYGIELLTGTYKFRMIFAVLDYFHNSKAETIIILCIVALLLARIPSIISQVMNMKEILEDQCNLDEMTDARDEE